MADRVGERIDLLLLLLCFAINLDIGDGHDSGWCPEGYRTRHHAVDLQQDAAAERHLESTCQNSLTCLPAQYAYTIPVYH
jgi:hypothetical protein